MTNYEGESSSQTVNLGWDSVTNINGSIQRDSTNNYFLNLTWNIPNIPENYFSVKFIITYKNNIHITTESPYKLYISYGETTTDPETGKTIAEEVCITIETRYYFLDGSYSSGEIKTFCFCPPIDPFCRKEKKTKVVNNGHKNISTKRKYANALKTSNGVLGMNFKNCSKASHWGSLGFTVGKNDCYKKPSYNN